MTYLDKFEKAKEQIWDNYDESFKSFKSIAQNLELPNSIRSQAYNFLGVIVSAVAPHLGEGDESGTSFYIKAIELDSDNIDALLNIISSYNTSTTNSVGLHKNHKLFLESIFRIKLQLRDSLKVDDMSKIENKFNEFLMRLEYPV